MVDTSVMEMNLAVRILQFRESKLAAELITTIEECDIPALSIGKKTIKQMGRHANV